MRIRCPGCGQTEAFTVVQPVMVTVDVDGDGEQMGGADFANEARGRWITCRECGRSWATKRSFDLRIDIR